jgi:hypothetical protein
MSDVREKGEPAFGEPNSFKPENGADLEASRGTTTMDGRKMSRIGPPIEKKTSIAETANGTDSASETKHGDLVAMEANNAIQYRTCSWPKVGGALKTWWFELMML